MTDAEARALLRRLFDAAVAEAQPEKVLPRFLPTAPTAGGRTVVIGAGKASAAMAAAFDAHWPHAIDDSLVVTRYGYAVACPRIRIVEAAHPVPDAASAEAAQAMLAIVGDLTADDLAIALISGGGSSLLSAPAAGLTLADKQAVNEALLKSGADIGEMNCVRKHLSAIKGGRLAAAAAPARLVTLAISDVPGDDPAVIASGPTVGDPTTRADALDIIERRGFGLTLMFARIWESDACETPKPGDAAFAKATLHLIATPQASLETAAEIARAAGVTPHILGDSIEGEAREVARVMAGVARQIRARGQPFAPPCLLLSGGETTVTVRGDGCGGRNVEFLNALAVEFAAMGAAARDIWAIAGDTDGVDGAETAGAIITPDTPARADAAGLSLRRHLRNNDAHNLFDALGDAVVTGPTCTNVNDFRAILIA